MLTKRFLELNLLGAEWVNWVLVIASFIGLAITIDRLLLYWRTRERLRGPPVGPPGSAARARTWARPGRSCAGDSLVRNVLRAGLDAVGRGERDPKSVEEEMLAPWPPSAPATTPAWPGSPPSPTSRRWSDCSAPSSASSGPSTASGQAGTTQSAGNPQVMSSIAEALASTAFGIFVAVPGRGGLQPAQAPTWASASARPSRSCASCSPTWARLESEDVQ